jgi:hypothetical protein
VPAESENGTFRTARFSVKARRRTSLDWYLSFFRMMHPLLQGQIIVADGGLVSALNSMQTEFEPELKLGLRGMWYPVCQSTAVSRRPLGLHRLGRDIVLWRDSRTVFTRTTTVACIAGAN